jgi:hypothetical protein
MSKFEKLTIATSLFAVFVSLGTPFLTYYWLDQLKHKTPLVVDQYYQPDKNDGVYKLEIQNPSKVPATDIKIMINVFAYDLPNPPAPNPKVHPDSPTTLEMQDNIATLVVKRALGPSEKMTVEIPEIKGPRNEVFHVGTNVYSDVGSAIHRDHTSALTEEQKRRLASIQ